MSDAITAGYAFLAVMRRDLHVYLSYRTRLVSQLLTSLFSLTLFYYISRLVHVSGFGSHKDYFGFVIVGIALVGVLYSCFSIPELVRQELIAGTFDRLLLSRFGAVRSVLAMTLFPIVYSFVIATITLGLGCAIFGLQLHWSTVPLAIPVMMLPVRCLDGRGQAGQRGNELGDRPVVDHRRPVLPRLAAAALAADGGQATTVHGGDGPAAPPARKQLAGRVAANLAAEAGGVHRRAAAGIDPPPYSRGPLRPAARNDHRVLTIGIYQL
jgi:hypothetical protein